ncbi:MAG: ABC transporter permease [Candidatus Aminicenantes bacterium]|nr:MAG: ABC transporter permease [Candidatus Aminicenantes bacterium]
MIANYLKVALRNIIKHKGISFINIFGLAVGMTCAILIILWVQVQLSYDSGQVNKDRIYRLENQTWVVMPPYLRETAIVFPEVEQAIRFYFWLEPTLKHNEKIFTVTEFALVDDKVFEVFNFNFIAGDPEKALANPFSLILTESIAKKLFGNDNPMGKMVEMNNRYDYTVTGIVEDIKNFHMNINAFISANDMTRIDGNDNFLTSRNYNHSIYLLVKPQADISTLAQKINDRATEVDRYQGDRLILRPFKNIYFANHLQHEKNTKHGNIHLIIVFSIIALFILGIACINFINLTIAKTKTREKEIAVRKVVGARKSSIQKQFFGETFIIVFIAFLLALFLARLLLPNFNTLTGEVITLAPFDMRILFVIVGIILFTAFISGIYPSFYLSVLEPVLVLKGKSGKGRKGSLLSKLLIAFQFVISISLIIATITVVRQLNFMQNADLGMNYEQMLTCTLRGDRFRGEAEQILSSKRAFKDRLFTNPAVRGVTYLNQLPGKITNTNTWPIPDRDGGIPLKVINADPDFIDLMELEVIEGRNFSYDTRTDLDQKYLLNEEAVRQFGFEEPVGSTTNSGRNTIIGIVKDFHFNSLHNKIGPMAISWDHWTRRACIKIAGTNIADTIKHIENVYREFCPGFAMEYGFLDESFARQYEAEKRLKQLLQYFVSIAIFISCLGLFALTAFIAEQKTKEIGIRKVLGLSNTGIFVLLSKNFAKWVLVANLISWPIAYYILNNWLKSFAYHIDPSIMIFILSGLIALGITLLTVGYQAVRAASANPADCLRYE